MFKEDIYTSEQENSDRIVLYKERLFWIAYERSAYLFHTHVRPYRAQRKYIKKIGCEVVSLGFPDSVLAIVGAPVIEQCEGKIVFQAPAKVDETAFAKWKDEALLYVKQPKFAPARDNVDKLTEQMVKRLREFNVESKTPVECMIFLADIKRGLHPAAV